MRTFKSKELAARETVIRTFKNMENIFSDNDGYLAVERLMNDALPEFCIVGATGHKVSADELRNGLESCIGKKPNIKIEALDFDVISSSDDLVALNFLEKQNYDGEDRVLRCTALICFSNGAPKWKFLHENVVTAA
ncbi:hypothetical protein [Francisella sp. LA112445]|uniref:hypothetical protein n=1 Tax=Francisella sp. LA112445 TaxID=1395624 RepID=UPI001788B0B9|nr:hypothetical protein [Francisella sp. LA112445]QIW09883.1 hypothetical protein FIP56_03985 [Francisella sp. LA112445]